MTRTHQNHTKPGFPGMTGLILPSLAVLAVLTACKNPLVGMGPGVDLNPPAGSVTGIANGDYVSGDISLTGTIEDDKEAQAVWATITGFDINGDAITPVDVMGTIDADGNWQIDLKTTEAQYGADGEKNVTISLQDTSDKITEKQMLLFFDNTPPVLMVTSPDLVSPQDTTPITIRGEAYDPLRLKEVRATIGQGSIDTIGDNQGTADSWLFELEHSVSGTETLGIVLVAEDQAGNISTAVFHTKDLRFLNDDESITVIDLYNLVDGVSLTGEVITPTDVLESTVHTGLPSGSSSTHLTFGGGTSGLPLDVDMSGDIPQITVTTPNPLIAAPGDTMGPASKVNGTVSDNVEVDETSIEIRFLEEDGVTEAVTWAPVTILPEQIINDQNINFSYSLPGTLPDANYWVEVRAEDNNGTPGQTASIPFRLDGNAPVIEITAPALSAYIANTGVQIEGTATDSEPITVEISLDGTNWETVTTLAAPGGSWAYTISDWEAVYGMGSFGDFDTIPISARATANGTTTYTNHSLIIDREAPVVEFLTPADSRDEFGVITGDVNGVVTLRVAVSDDSLDAVTHKIGINGPVQAVDSDSLYNWSEIIVTTNMEDPNLATEISPGIWELPVTVTASDKAGNSTVTSDYTIIIDNAQDRPNVSIIYPIEGESYGGEVTVSGIATDDDGTVGAVYVQVDLDTPPLGTPDFATNSYAFTDGIDFDGNGGVLDVDEALPYQVSGLSSWSFSLNTTGELYSTDAFGGDGGHDGDIYVKVWAEDPINATVTSVPQILHFRLDDTLPRIDSVEIDGVAVGANQYVSGVIDLDVETSDDTQINKLEISYDNGVSWENRGITPAPSVSHTIPIDTASEVAGGNGILYLRLKATDNTGYTTLEVLPLNVDNNPPEGTYPGTEPVILTGVEALLQGTASDPNGSIAGVDRIEVYLERNGGIYDPQSLLYDYETNYDPDVAAEEATFGAGNYYPVDPEGDGVMAIDDVNELGTDLVIGDEDGYNESLTLVASTWNWWVEFNSENIPDGDINIHYVVVDKAGNKTHYAKGARIENNPPVIESVVLGTDVNYNTSVSSTVGGGESFRFIDGTGTPGAGEIYADFDAAVNTITSRNNMLYIDADEASGNGNGDSTGWLWELYYKGGGANLLGAGVDSTTITTEFASVPMNDETGVSFILRVTDDADLSDEVELILDLDNDDAVPPTVTLFDLDLTQNFTILARGGAGNNGYPVPGFDPSEEPLWDSASGRLRPAGEAGGYDGTDADVSGTVIVSGTVFDDKVIDHVDLTITGYDGDADGGVFTILDWDSTANGNLGGLKLASGVTGTAHISTESYGESAGHAVSWSFEFDTSAISGTAAANVTVLAEGRDKSGGLGNDDYTMDVMPFVTRLARSNTGANPVYRTRFGSWPFPEGSGSPIWIYGFNLDPDAGSTQIDSAGGSEVFFADPSGSTTTLSGLLATGASTTPITHSGDLTFTVNTIPLMNEYGDFDEDDGDNPDWTDDRYVEIWKVGDSFTGSGYGVYGSMTVDESDGSYMASWSNWSTASVYTAPQGGARTQRYYRYDPPEYTDIDLNSDGTPYVAVLANFLGGSWATADSGGLGLWTPNAYEAEDYGGNVMEEADAFLQDTMLWQFRNPRITVTGDDTDTDIYLTYFDQADSALKFSHFKDTGGQLYNLTLYADATGDNNSTWSTRAGTNNPNFIRDLNDDVDLPLYDLNIVEDGTNSTYYGSWSDVAVDQRVGAPVIIFSDIDNSSVRLMRATSMNPTDHDSGNLLDMEWIYNTGMVEDTDGSDSFDDAVLDWHPSQTVFSGDSYKYVSVVMDPDGNLHASAYKVSTGELVYRYAPALTTTNAADSEAYAFTDVETVDDVGNVGKWADLSLVNRGATAAAGDRDYYPVISYLDSSWVGTYRGLKVARKLPAGWETGYVPLDTSVEDGRLSAIGSLYEGRITANADDYELGVGYHSTEYEFIRLRPEQ